MGQVSGIKKVILDFKIYYTLNFIYPKKAPFKKIKSILSHDENSVGSDVVIEENVEIGPYLKALSTGLYIGKNTYVGYCDFIGKYTSISSNVKIGLIAHPTNYISTSPVFYSKRRGWVKNNLYLESEKGFTQIGNDVLISANVIILAGVKIGNGAIIGAGSFVNKDIPPYAIVVGMPARIIRYRFDTTQIESLENIKWWDLPKEELLKHEEYFRKIDHIIDALKGRC